MATLTEVQAEQVRRMAEERADTMVSRLRELVHIETPSTDLAQSATIAELLTDRLSTLGATVVQQVCANGTNVIATVPAVADADESHVLLLGHSDTVWPIGTLTHNVIWSQQTVAGTDIITGPGSYDMKSGLVIIETALAILRELGVPHPPLRILITCDEEIGSPESTSLVAEHSAGARAVFGFESPHPDGALKLGRRGSTRITLRVTGREAHAALDPGKGISAIDELVDQLIAVRRIIGQHTAAAKTAVLCNVGAIEAPGRANVIPAHANALIGLRFTDQEVEDAVLDALSRLTPVRAGAEVEVELLSRRPTWQPHDTDRALFAAVRHAATALGLQLDARPAAGAADTNLTGALGIATLDGFGPRGAGAHATNEQIVTSSFVERTALLVSALATLATP